jgi:hypothetical protein
MTSPPFAGVAGIIVMVMGLLMPVLVSGVGELPACGCMLVGVEAGCAALPEAPVAEVPAAVAGESVAGAESLEQFASSDPRTETAA